MAEQIDSALIRHILRDLPLGIWVARASDGSEVYANDRFAAIMGMDLLGSATAGEYSEPYGIFDRDGREYPEAQLPFVRALQAGGPVEQDDLVVHRPDGARVNVRAFASPVFDDGGKAEFVVVAFSDITEEVTAKQARVESDARAQRAARMESIGNLAGGIAHDFNNMLAVIRTTAFLVENEEEAIQRQADLALVRDITLKAGALTRSLLDFSGRVEGKKERICLSVVVEAVLPILRRAFDKRIAIHTDLGAEREIIGDRAKLEQVVMNLAFNAADAMPDGEGRLKLSTWDDADSTVLEVQDTGQGVPDEIRERIFEPYFTTKTDDNRRGAGLGLATVLGVARGHGGHVDLQTNPGEGTRVRVVLLAEAPETAETQPVVAAPTDVPANGGCVLVVEDDSAVRYVTNRALRLLGFSVVSAEEGYEGVRIFEQEHESIDAVLLDVRMPGLDGRETFRRLQGINEKVPVLFMTGLGGEEQRRELGELGAEGCLSKPVDMDELGQELARVIESSRK